MFLRLLLSVSRHIPYFFFWLFRQVSNRISNTLFHGIRGKDSRKDVQSLHKVGHNTRCTWGSNSLRVESRSWVLHYVAWALSCCSARLPSSLLHTCPGAHRQYYLKLVFFCRQFVGNLDKAKLKLESHYLPSCWEAAQLYLVLVAQLLESRCPRCVHSLFLILPWL